MSLSYRKESKDSPKTVIVLDFDETIAISEKKPTGEYVIQPDGSINASPMNTAQLNNMVKLAILHNVPIHVVTGRVDTPGDRKVMAAIIKEADGFHSGLGGFNPSHIHFTSQYINGVYTSIFKKSEIVNNLHQTLYPSLSKKNLLFVDDMDQYLKDVEAAGYSTLKADPDTQTHFGFIQKFIVNRESIYSYQPLFFNQTNPLSEELIQKEWRVSL